MNEIERKDIIRINEISRIFPKPENYEDIKKDIEERGIQEPLVVNKSKKLICGYTRLDIADELTIDKIPIRVIVLDDLLLMKEYAIKDNIHRRQLSKVELVELYGKPLEEIEKEKARRRMELGKKTENGDPVDKMTTGSKGKTRDNIGQLLGMSGKTYDRWNTIVEKGSDATKQHVKDGVINQKTALELCKVDKKKQEMLLEKTKSHLETVGIAKKINKIKQDEKCKKTEEYERKNIIEFFSKHLELEKYKDAVLKNELEIDYWQDKLIVPFNTLAKGSFTGIDRPFPKYSGQKIKNLIVEGWFAYHQYPVMTEKEWKEINEARRQRETVEYSPGFIFEGQSEDDEEYDDFHENVIVRRTYNPNYGHKVIKYPLDDIFNNGIELYIKQGWGSWCIISFNDGNGHRINRRFFVHDYLFNSLVKQAIESARPDVFSDENYSELKIRTVQRLKLSWFYARRNTVGIDQAINAMEEDLRFLKKLKRESLPEEKVKKKALEYLADYTIVWNADNFREGVSTHPRKVDGSCDIKKKTELFPFPGGYLESGIKYKKEKTCNGDKDERRFRYQKQKKTLDDWL